MGWSLALLALSTCCAGSPFSIKENNKPVEIQSVKLAGAGVREGRADFDAAMIFIKAGDYGKGIELLNKVTEVEKNNSAPYINLAMAYFKAGNLKLAEENFKSALNIDPDNPVANNELALLYRKTGKFSEARLLYEKVLEKYPGYYVVHKNLGILCDLYMRDYECALKQYDIYSGAMPDDKASKIWIADIQKRLTK